MEPIWAERYRPQVIDDVILPNRIKKLFKQWVAEKSIPNLLLTGSSGVGKTTIAKAFCNELNAEYLFINGSDERNIDTLRGKIRNFASKVSFDGKPKVVIIDEADYLNCLEENEEIFAKLENDDHFKLYKLKDLIGKNFYVLSLNSNYDLEIDDANIVSEANKEIFEIEFDDSSKMLITEDHPLLNKSFNKVKINEECIYEENLMCINNIEINSFIEKNDL